MKISTRGRYALRLMLDLALQPQGTLSSIRVISERQQISEKYLEQIVPSLVRAGFVSSVRGAQGGYRLARPAAEYTVGDILRQMEGRLVPVACLETTPNRCERCDECVTLEVWEKIEQAVAGVVDHITLEDLVTRSARLEKNHKVKK